MKFLYENDFIVGVKLNKFEFCIVCPQIKIAEKKQSGFVVACSGFYHIPIDSVELNSNYPDSECDFPIKKNHKPGSMRIIHGAEAVLLYMRKANTFMPFNVVSL